MRTYHSVGRGPPRCHTQNPPPANLITSGSRVQLLGTDAWIAPWALRRKASPRHRLAICPRKRIEAVLPLRRCLLRYHTSGWHDRVRRGRSWRGLNREARAMDVRPGSKDRGVRPSTLPCTWSGTVFHKSKDYCRVPRTSLFVRAVMRLVGLAPRTSGACPCHPQSQDL